MTTCLSDQDPEDKHKSGKDVDGNYNRMYKTGKKMAGGK